MVPILEKIGKLPDKDHYILQIEGLEEKERYLGFELYVWKDGNGENLEDVMREIQVKHIKEITQQEQ